ncbi:hypothetical protein WDL1CHR_03168 [Variovorax sp. WDL1]|nr:hypothetical protein CHC07_00339 [Variovorax sp. B4]PNG61596.1 hypothetical protein CHC06_01497 [Variovorax sp. B2]VTV12369.1 hypothetical protein WDL1CHR_03168 [Variovorax sp. WDL1]
MLRAGAVPRLRTALLLLDNCTEVLLDRWIEDRLAHEDMQRQIKIRAVEAAIPKDHPHLADLFVQTFLTATDASRVARLFNEKLAFASERGALAPTVVSVLSHIHRYRNESYPGGRVRPGILSTTVAIQIHLVCDLVRTLQPASAGYSSKQDFSWLTERFGIRNPSTLWEEREIRRVLAEIRGAANVDIEAAPAALAENLEERIEALDETVEFLVDEAQIETTPDAVIAAAQAFTLKKLSSEVAYPPPPRGLDKLLDSSVIDRVRHIPDMLRNPSDSLKVFDVFADADAALDRTEYVLGQLAMAVDQAIQLEIDRARDK